MTGKPKASGTKGNSSNNSKKKLFVGAGAAAGIIAIVVAFVMGSSTNQATTASSQDPIIAKIAAPSVPGAAALGSSSAKVTIVEFGDYQCNSCELFYKETKDQLLANYVNTGKAKFLFKDFPINDVILQPPNASSLAAEASYCAADQGKYWQYHDELYNNQKKEGIVWVSEDVLKQFATNVGIKDPVQFSQCLDSHKYAGIVKDNYNLAMQLGFNATPTFVIMEDGKQPVKLVGAYPYVEFDKVLTDLQNGQA
jgi:protein-disulfide isomerase